MRKRLSRRKIPDSAVLVEVAEDSRLLEFSFKHLDLQNPRFHSDSCDSAYLCSLLECIRRYSNYTVGQFTNFNHESDRNTIDPEKLRDQLADKMLDEQLLDSEAWEFKVAPDATIPPRSLWRAHGVRIGNVFYVIWLDPKHKLFESKHPKHKKISGKG